MAGAGFFVGLLVLCVALLFIREPRRFRRVLGVGIVVVVGSAAWWWWLVMHAFAERLG